MNIFLCHLPALRSLDLGSGTNHFILEWHINAVQIPLSYLRLSLRGVRNLLRIMSTRPLFNTLRQLHVSIRDMWLNRNFKLPATSLLPRMINLHTFTLVKPLLNQLNDEWGFIEALTSSTVMPILRRINLTIVINVADLNRIDRSMLFTDHRRVDVHYALILTDDQQHIDLSERIPHGSRSHRRQIASASFVKSSWPDNEPRLIPDESYVYGPQARCHLWYTLPWAFKEFFQLPVPDRCITQMQVFGPPRLKTAIGASRLRRLNVSGDAVSPVVALPNVLSLNCIEEFHLFGCDRRIRMRLPALRHMTLIDSLDALHSCSSISTNIRSIMITLRQSHITFATGNWTALRALAALPLLSSLRVVLYDIRECPDDSSCQIIAERAVLLVDFSFCFRVYDGSLGHETKSAYKNYRSFIEQLLRRIGAISLDRESRNLVEKDGCGLMMWF